MNFDEQFYKYALMHQPSMGSATAKKIYQHMGSAQAVFTDSEPLRRMKKKWRTNIPFPTLSQSVIDSVSKELAYMQKHNISSLFWGEPSYPKRLQSCKDAPFLLYYMGDPHLNREKVVAIIGTRNSTRYGADVVEKVVHDLAQTNVSIVSGLAFGIDTLAHTQALTKQLNTVAVLGCGLKQIYPIENTALANEIINSGGTLLTEYPFETKPDRPHFPMRNRIIAGMVDAVIVAETKKKGGSIITACIAHSYNRDVFAVPGSIFSNSYSGCHELIRQNLAAVITSGNDVIEMMNWQNNGKQLSIQPQLFEQLSKDEEEIVEAIITFDRPTFDEIAEKLSNVSLAKLTAVLLQLELRNIIECLPGKTYRLIGNRI